MCGIAGIAALDASSALAPEAAAQVRDWRERLGISVPVSVNVSRIDMYDPDLVDNLERIVADNELTHDLILLEITESAYTQDSAQMIDYMKQTVGSHMGLLSGEQLTVRQLLDGLMVCSANDAARALAIYVAGSQDAFVDMMNAKAQEIGAYHTHYLNPNGYTESWDHCTTARDMGIITDYAFSVPGFADLVSQPSVTIPKTNKSEARKYRNTNLLLWDTRKSLTLYDGSAAAPKYEGAFGVKTGMMWRAGYCLVAGAERDGMRLIVICMNGREEDARFEDSIALFDWAFANYETRELVPPGMDCGKVQVKGGEPSEVEAYCEGGILLTRDKTIEGSDQYEIVPYSTVEAPLVAGDQVGYISYTTTGGEQEREPIVVREDVPATGLWKLFHRTSDEMQTILLIAGLCAAVTVLLIAAVVHNARKKRRKNDPA